jgi:peptide/nickel transport system substrate-binding protein
MDGLLESNFEKARDMLREAGYDGTPVVLMRATDNAVLTNLAPVATSLMERAGFKVDMQSMDGQSMLARFNRKVPPNAGGWNAVVLSLSSVDARDPMVAGPLNTRCDNARPGWPCDQEIEMLRDRYASETDPAKQKQIAEAVQMRAIQVTTHVILGQWFTAVAVRKNVVGMPIAPVPVFWNVEKTAGF